MIECVRNFNKILLLAFVLPEDIHYAMANYLYVRIQGLHSKDPKDCAVGRAHKAHEKSLKVLIPPARPSAQIDGATMDHA